MSPWISGALKYFIVISVFLLWLTITTADRQKCSIPFSLSYRNKFFYSHYYEGIYKDWKVCVQWLQVVDN